MDGLLSFSYAEEQITGDYILLYMLSMCILAYAGLSFNLLSSLVELASSSALILLIRLVMNEILLVPQASKFGVFILMQVILGIAIHIIISVVGFWYVNIVVKLQSDGELLDSVDDSIMLVEP